MKKIIAFLILVTLVLTLCSCGASDDEVRGETKRVEEVTTEYRPETDAPEETYDPIFASGNTYTNEYFGFGFTLGDDWVFATEEEIKEMNGIAAEKAGDEYKELMEKASVIYEVSASSNSVGSISVNIENVGVAGVVYDEKAYIEAGKDLTVQSLENIGCTNVTFELQDIKFAGETRCAAYVTAEINGQLLTECLIPIKNGTRFANVAVSTVNDNIDELLSYFYVVD